MILEQNIMVQTAFATLAILEQEINVLDVTRHAAYVQDLKLINVCLALMSLWPFKTDFA